MSNAMGAQAFPVVKAAVASWMEEAGDAELHEACGGVARSLDLIESVSGRSGEADRERLKGQVKRALDLLAGEGTLVRVSQGEEPPTGLTRLDRPRWYTPAKFAAVKQAAAIYADQLATEARRWEQVSAALTLAGYDPLTATTGPVMLSLGDWERLVESNGLPAVNAQGANESLLRYRKRTRAAEAAKDLAGALQGDDMEQVRRLLAEVTTEVDEVRSHDARAHI